MDDLSQRVALLRCSRSEIWIDRISATYKIPVVSDEHVSSCRYLLVIEDGLLKLTEPGSSRYRPIFLNTSSLSRVSRRSLLGRAMGPNVQTIVDATAGLGGDAMLLARMGFRVLAIERHSAIAALVENGIARAKSECEQLSIGFCYSDAKDVLYQLQEPPDVVYIDPMYPEGRKSSVKVVRPIRVIRDLAGDDPDATGLFDVSIRTALRRVVVKRPHFAQPLSRDRLSGSVSGKLVRYDIYQPFQHSEI